jgi:predicted alpha/beta-hydrolase family hydrolase
MDIETSAGVARAEIAGDQDAAFVLTLTHGSSGGPGTADLAAAATAARDLGGAVALITQPYRLRGARAPGSAARQDAAWAELTAGLMTGYPGRPLVQGGRSNGARVACRTAIATGASGVIALAFPLHPPGRPEKSRAGELRGAGVPVLVINGDRDPFGVPDTADADRLVVLRGQQHALASDPAAITAAVRSWLSQLLG